MGTEAKYEVGGRGLVVNEQRLRDGSVLRLWQVRRDWSALKDLRVDRRYNKLGKIAQMLRDHDGTPPAEVRWWFAGKDKC